MFLLPKKITKLKITDDSGFLAIANADQYQSFVDEDWQLTQLIKHFVEQMNKENLIIWATGTPGEWTVSFSDKASNKKAFRAFTKSVHVTNRQLHLTNYEDLTMAAQFTDNKVPAEENAALKIKLDNGQYHFTIRQLFDPEDYDYDPEGKINFEIIIQVDNTSTRIIDHIFWQTT